ncbi:cytochrome P450 9e2-like [Atheta coriaria]|uniref:cytochrome P450 9e2-like n=1 Tax=Dalotia coriaria TaxID=877792 RepID=UPI0031F36663
MLLLLFGIAVSIYIYSYIKGFDFWNSKGVKQAPIWTSIKENFQTTVKSLSFMNLHLRNYKRDTKTSRFIGFYQFGRPMLMIRDPELLKQIAVKDREKFINRQNFILPGSDPFWDSNLFALSDEKWRIMRSTLSPAFTTNKMKAMFVLMDESARDFATYFVNNNQQKSTHQMKDTFRRFATDVIANCAFGHKCNSLLEKNNPFYTNGVAISNFSGFWRSIEIALGLIHKNIAKALNVTAFKPKTSAFFLDIIKGQLKIRQEKNIVRPDMLNLLLEARKGQLKHEGPEQDAGFATVQESDYGKGKQVKMDFTDVEITAQVMFFFVAGFDTISSSLSFISYEMALHQEIQQRLREEIDETLEKCNGHLTYDALIGMKYMDMVISESLRKWPPALFTDRLPTGTYKIQKSPDFPDEPDELVLNETSSVSIPIYPIHNDPEFYPHPEVFDPERFNDDNKKNIKPYTYLPFGLGPRSCIGSRFALMELKVLFFHLLQQFEIVPDVKTQIPVQISKGLFNLDSVDGIWLSFKKRQ